MRDRLPFVSTIIVSLPGLALGVTLVTDRVPFKNSCSTHSKLSGSASTMSSSAEEIRMEGLGEGGLADPNNDENKLQLSSISFGVDGISCWLSHNLLRIIKVGGVTASIEIVLSAVREQLSADSTVFISKLTGVMYWVVVSPTGDKACESTLSALFSSAMAFALIDVALSSHAVVYKGTDVCVSAPVLLSVVGEGVATSTTVRCFRIGERSESKIDLLFGGV